MKYDIYEKEIEKEGKKEVITIPFFNTSENLICMPNVKQFNCLTEYYSTFAHECVHSTGPYLNRDMSGTFGSDKYAFEELVAEMGASIVCSHLGVEFEGKAENNQTAYLVGWGKRFKNNPSLLWDVLKAAQKAAQYMQK